MDDILITDDVSDPDDPLNKMIPLKPIENYYDLSKKLKHTYRVSHSDSHAPYTELFGQRPECFHDAQQKLMVVLGKYHFECTTSLSADQVKHIKTDGLTTKQIIQLVTDFTLFKSDIEKYVDPPDIIAANTVISRLSFSDPRPLFGKSGTSTSANIPTKLWFAANTCLGSWYNKPKEMRQATLKETTATTAAEPTQDPTGKEHSMDIEVDTNTTQRDSTEAMQIEPEATTENTSGDSPT